MSRRTLYAALLVLIVSLLFIQRQPAIAASFQVTATADSVDAAPGDGICADASGACSLRAAVMETNALAGADWIEVPAGTYALTLNTFAETGANVGDIDITDHLTIQGSGADLTIITGQVRDRNFHIRTGVIGTFSGMTITSGDALHNHETARGSNIYNEGGILTLIGCIISDGAGYGSIANYAGGIVLIQDSRIENNPFSSGVVNANSTMTIQQSTVANNYYAGSGGGISNSGSLLIQSSTLSGNRAFNHAGGISNSGDLMLEDVTLMGNVGGRGGAIYSIAGTVTISDSAFIDNRSVGGGTLDVYNSLSLITNSTFQEPEGTAIVGRWGADLTLQNADVSNSSVGIWNLYSRVLVDHSTIHHNETGIYLYRGDLEVSHSTISENHNPDDVGGGLHLNGRYGSASIHDSIIENNSATHGGGIYLKLFDTPVAINNTIIRNNFAIQQGGGIYAVSTDMIIANSVLLNNQANYSGDALFYGYGDLLNMTGNCIVSNGAIGVYSTYSEVQSIRGNWWGSVDGPSGVGAGSGDSVSERLDFSSWLVAAPSICAGS